MNDPGVMSSLERRVAELERRYRQTRFAAVVFGAIAAVAILTAQSSSSPSVFGDPQGAHTTIGPDGVYVFDAQGKQRLRMRLGSNNVPAFAVATSDGKDVATLNGSSSGGFLRFSTNTGTEAAYVGVYSDGSSGIDVDDMQGKARVSLSTDKDGSAGLTIRNSAEKPMVSLYQSTSGDGFLRIRDKSSLVVRAYFGVTTGGNPALQLFDGGEKIRAFAGQYTNGSSGLAAYDSSGTVVWSSPSGR